MAHQQPGQPHRSGDGSGDEATPEFGVPGSAEPRRRPGYSDWPGWTRCASDRRFDVRYAAPADLIEPLHVCSDCDARDECLDWVIDRRGIFGPSLGGRFTYRIFGGVLPSELAKRIRSRWGENRYAAPDWPE